MKLIVRLAAATALALAWAAPAAAQGEGEAPTVRVLPDTRYAGIVDAFVDGYARPSYARLATAAKALDAAAPAYCADPTAGEAAMRDAFAAVVAAWARVDFLRIGPATREARLERFSFWPDPRGFTEKQVRQLLNSPDLDSLDVAKVAGRGAAAQGLPAFERLVLDPKTSPAAADFAGRCRLATLIATNLANIAGELDAGWRAPDGIAGELLEPGPTNPLYRSEQEATQEVMRAIVTAVEQIRDLYITPALGASADAAKPHRLAYGRAGLAKPFLVASVEAAGDLIATTGFTDDLGEEAEWAERSVPFELENIDRTLAGLPDDPEAMVTDPHARSKLGYAAVALASVRDTVTSTVAPALGLTVGFNALDGD